MIVRVILRSGCMAESTGETLRAMRIDSATRVATVTSHRFGEKSGVSPHETPVHCSMPVCDALRGLAPQRPFHGCFRLSLFR